MAVLTMYFASDNASYTMHPMGSHVPTESGLTIRQASIIHRGERALVYKGELTVGEKKEALEVAVKLVAGSSSHDLEQLEDEYNHYARELKELQGKIVPMCYGLFQVPNKYVACLVLQYCGEPILCEFDELDMDRRLDILECLMEIHDAGLEHRDFEPRNVLVKDGHIFVVDFESATEHECGRTMDIVEGALPPNEFYFDCWELYRYAYENCIWRAGFFMVLGTAVPERFATSYESVAKAARDRGLSPLADPEFVHRDIQQALRFKEAIDENDNLRPRLEVLKAKGVF